MQNCFDFFNNHGQSWRLWFDSQVRYRERELGFHFHIYTKYHKYLFIRGNRLNSQFHPVAVVYKLLKEVKPALEDLKYSPDTRMNNSEGSNGLSGKYD